MQPAGLLALTGTTLCKAKQSLAHSSFGWETRVEGAGVPGSLRHPPSPASGSLTYPKHWLCRAPTLAALGHVPGAPPATVPITSPGWLQLAAEAELFIF